MDIRVTFPGNKRVDAQIGPHIVETDQPAELGGDGSAVAPFDLFLASLGTCAGIYVLGFCQARGIPTEGLSLVEHVEHDPATHLPSSIRIEVRLPPGFPEKYRLAVLRAAEGCKVKKAIAAPPTIEVVASDEASPVAKAS
jgi:ribosomal protein S12 methylthiotransferase accessory factor